MTSLFAVCESLKALTVNKMRSTLTTLASYRVSRDRHGGGLWSQARIGRADRRHGPNLLMVMSGAPRAAECGLERDDPHVDGGRCEGH
jgi:hypothetical protein